MHLPRSLVSLTVYRKNCSFFISRPLSTKRSPHCLPLSALCMAHLGNLREAFQTFLCSSLKLRLRPLQDFLLHPACCQHMSCGSSCGSNHDLLLPHQTDSQLFSVLEV